MKKRIWQSLIFFMTCFSFLSLSFAEPIDKIIVFGDSLSDNGNILSITSKARKILPLVPLIPKNPPYYEGRFSNGFTWVETLAKLMNVPLSNYAYGGAWAEPFYDSLQILPFGLGLQVDMYLVSAVTDFHKSKHLYVIWAGGNDYIHGRIDAKYATDNTILHIEKQIDWLTYYGAKQLLLLTLPDLSAVPAIKARGIEFSAKIGELSRLHNEKLIAMVEKQRLLHPDVNIVLSDVNGLYKDLLEHPDKYKIKNITEACYGGGYFFNRVNLEEDPALKAAKDADLDIAKNDFLSLAYVNSLLAEKGVMPCKNPDEFLYWDKLHPTRIAHTTIANTVFASLAAGGVTSAPATPESTIHADAR